MSGIYHMLAPFYDALNSEVDYDGYLAYIQGQFGLHMDKEPKRILDLACGTGSMTLPLAKAGYDVVGLDLSPEMLSVAQERVQRARLSRRVFLTMQDMTDFDVGERVDAVVCTLDGVNHLPNTKAVSACFASVRNALKEGGLFLFDLNSKRKFGEVYGNEAYTMEADGAYCVWQNAYHPNTGVCDFYINLFVEDEDGRYERYEDLEREKYYSLSTIQKLLKQNGFECIGIYGNTDAEAVTDDNDRWYVVARAITPTKETI